MAGCHGTVALAERNRAALEPFCLSLGQCPVINPASPLPHIKTNYDVYRLLALAWCAIAGSATAEISSRDLTPVQITVRRPPVQWQESVSADDTPELTLPVMTGTGSGVVQTGNNPIIVTNPPLGTNAPITLVSGNLVINAAGTGTLTLPGLKPRPIPVISPVTGEVIWRQFPPPLNVPNSSGGSVVIDAGGWSSGDSSGATLVTTIPNDSFFKLYSRRLILSAENNFAGGTIVTRGTGLDVSGFSSSGGATVDIGGHLNLTGGGTLDISGGTLNLNHPLVLGSGGSVSLGNGTLNITNGFVGMSDGTITRNWRYQFEPSGSDVTISGSGSMVMDAGSSNFVLTGFTDGDPATGTAGDAVLLKYADGDFFFNGTLQGDDFAMRLQGTGNDLNTVTFGNFGSVVVPEPASLSWLFAGAFALGVLRRRTKAH
jgi:hypothetical protein